jgi:hypothetical protein
VQLDGNDFGVAAKIVIDGENGPSIPKSDRTNQQVDWGSDYSLCSAPIEKPGRFDVIRSESRRVRECREPFSQGLELLFNSNSGQNLLADGADQARAPFFHKFSPLPDKSMLCQIQALRPTPERK